MIGKNNTRLSSLEGSTISRESDQVLSARCGAMNLRKESWLMSLFIARLGGWEVLEGLMHRQYGLEKLWQTTSAEVWWNLLSNPNWNFWTLLECPPSCFPKKTQFLNRCSISSRPKEKAKLQGPDEHVRVREGKLGPSSCALKTTPAVHTASMRHISASKKYH